MAFIRVVCVVVGISFLITPGDSNVVEGKEKSKRTSASSSKAKSASKNSGKGKAKRGKAKRGKQGKSGGKSKSSASQVNSPSAAIRGDVLRWILANNTGLGSNFLNTEPPQRTIKLPNGRTVAIYRLKQFHATNFRLTFFARKNEKGSDVVPVMEERLRKLMCLPAYYEFIKKHRKSYKINGKKVSSEQAYNHFRHIHRHLGVTAGKQYKAPVGGGGGIAAPSWAVFKAMNIFHHEACHCIGINHDSGGLSGPLSGALRTWDRQKKWNYSLIDLNQLPVR